MSLDYLARIVHARFPLRVRRASEIDKVRLLKAAEFITASVARRSVRPDAEDEVDAVVFGVTERGDLALREARPPPEAPLRRGRRPLDDD